MPGMAQNLWGGSPHPMFSRSRGLGKGQVADPEYVEEGVIVRWGLEEAQSKSAGRLIAVLVWGRTKESE